MPPISQIANAGELTYMSIQELIQARLMDQMLFTIRPAAAGSTSRRALFVSEELWNFLSTEHLDAEMEDRVGYLLADLDTFADGTELHPRYLFLLSPSREAVWEIRSTIPDPSIRVLGRFAAKEVFIATNYALRDDLEGWQSRPWRDVKVKSRTVWTNLFHTYRPIVTTNVHDVVTGAIDGKYFKE